MKLTVNGEEHQFDGEMSISTLLEHFQLNPQQVAVELNRHIVKKPDYQTTALKHGDVLEVVHFVGGG